MEATGKNYGYIEWLSAEEMHDTTLQWISELKFVRDEQQFLNDLVTSYTPQLLDQKVFEESQGITRAISKSEKEAIKYLQRVKSHENLLEIMINDIDELKMEKAYIETHWELVSEIKKYMNDYRELKSALFHLVAKVKKMNKRLLK
ncbi:hypothetical protein [uncultured Kriegella sp.]|uniref:hypothetical protein n=1 Tax=uncultured Kriegella sp. TaxID=1798910 RepID=UPI0030D931C4|tara:strand:- start:54515 stop:54952 length:438 start_codon:yes stop_codon:yes gene_type:complete